MVCCHVLGCELWQISCYFRSSRAVLAGRVKISGVGVGGKPGELLQNLQGKPFACMTQGSLRDMGSAATWRQTHVFAAAVGSSMETVDMTRVPAALLTWPQSTLRNKHEKNLQMSMFRGTLGEKQNMPFRKRSRKEDLIAQSAEPSIPALHKDNVL